eukprot:118709_1
MNNAMNNPLMMPMNQNIMSKKWPCKACTFSNHGWTDRCEVCSAERCVNNNTNNNSPIGSPIYNSVSKNKFVFNANVNEMEMKSQSQIQPWCCPICTLLNHATDVRCEACNTARNGLQEIGLPENLINDSFNNDYESMVNMGMDPSMNDSKNNDHFEPTVEDFSRVASDIACFNDNPN